MRIIVLSDTHIPSVQSSLPEDVIHAIDTSDMILGLGDFTTEETIHFLKGYSQPFYGVLGNMDAYELRDYLPLKRTLDIEGFSVYMTHGWGSRDGLEERIYKRLPFPKPDFCLFGHSHTQTDRIIGKTRFINPGTCRKGGSFALLETTQEMTCSFYPIEK
ncbi:MAG: metallophosphoesterase family protein [Thermotogota bacterium]